MSRLAYERLRRRTLLARLRLAIWFGLPALVGGAIMDEAFAPDRLTERLAGFAFLGTAYVAMLAVIASRTLRRHPRALAVAFMLVLAGGLVYLLSLSPDDLDVLTGPVTCVMVGSTLLFPWGASAQAIVSGAIAVGFGALVWPHLPADGMRATNVATSLAVSMALSIMGAIVLERSRASAFVDRQRVRALAVQRRRLIDVGRDVRSTLLADEIARRVVGHAKRLVAADGVLFALRAPADPRYRIVATAGAGRFERFAELEWSDDFTRALCAAFPPCDVREVPGGALDGAVMPLFEPLAIRRTLIAAVGPHPAPPAFVAWLRNDAVPFTRAERMAAQGIADQACTALAAARLYDDAARASRLKSEFVSTMSHELRTPLNVIMGYNQILDETLPRDPETTHALDAVRRASNELLDLVEATLDLGRLESGRENVHEDVLRVRDLFDELAREFVAVPRAVGVALEWDAGDDPTLVVDRRKLKTVLKNLTANALKFTPAGSVRVDCCQVGDRCRFRVLDTGIGIPAKDQAAVFEMFRQADSSDSRRYSGTGLGLYIVRHLVRLLGGEVTLESTPGRGSIFSVTLPLVGSTAGTRERSAA